MDREAIDGYLILFFILCIIGSFVYDKEDIENFKTYYLKNLSAEARVLSKAEKKVYKELKPVYNQISAQLANKIDVEVLDRKYIRRGTEMVDPGDTFYSRAAQDTIVNYNSTSVSYVVYNVNTNIKNKSIYDIYFSSYHTDVFVIYNSETNSYDCIDAFGDYNLINRNDTKNINIENVQEGSRSDDDIYYQEIAGYLKDKVNIEIEIKNQIITIPVDVCLYLYTEVNKNYTNINNMNIEIKVSNSDIINSISKIYDYDFSILGNKLYSDVIYDGKSKKD